MFSSAASWFCSIAKQTWSWMCLLSNLRINTWERDTMRNTFVFVLALVLVCPTFSAEESREQKRLAACSQVFKEIMDIPDGIPKDLLNKAECVIVIPSVLKFAFGVGGDFGRSDYLPDRPTLHRPLERASIVCTGRG